MDAGLQRLARRQISESLSHFRSTPALPRAGWIEAIRTALGMTGRQLAARLKIAPSGVTRLEQRERDGGLTLSALRRAAEALDCELVYALVPRHSSAKAGYSFDEIIAARAKVVAEREMISVAHSMALEDQAVRPSELAAQVAERAAVLSRTPRFIWNDEEREVLRRPVKPRKKRQH